MIKAVVFDMDGVIINSIPVHFKAWQKLLSEYGINYSFKEFEEVIGLSTKDIMTKLKSKYGIKESVERMEQEKVNLYVKYLEREVTLFDGVLALLEKLKKKNLLIAVASSEPKKTIEIVFKKFNLQKYFNYVLGEEDVVHPKPNPEVFIKASSELNVFPNQCLVIEDSPSGITAAKLAGMKCVAITTTYKRKDFKKADFVIDRFSELNLNKVLR